MTRLEGFDVDYFNKKFPKRDSRRGEAQVLLSLARMKGAENKEIEKYNFAFLIVGYLLSFSIIIGGIIFSYFYLLLGFCLFGATLFHNRWYNKRFRGEKKWQKILKKW